MLKWLFSPVKSPYNAAVEKRRTLRYLILDQDRTKFRSTLVDIVELCRQEIARDTGEGNAYILLADSLSMLADEYDNQEGESSLQIHRHCLVRAAAAIHHWNTNRDRLYTKDPRNGDLFLRSIKNDIAELFALEDERLVSDKMAALYQEYFERTLRPPDEHGLRRLTVGEPNAS